MFRISKQQWTDMARRDFRDRLEALLCVNLPDSAVNAYDVLQMAEHCVVTAERYGLATERAIAAFGLHMVRINPEFHLQPSMHALLDDRSVDDCARMERLLTDTAESDWEEAVTMCDPAAYWRPFLKANLTPASP